MPSVFVSVVVDLQALRAARMPVSSENYLLSFLVRVPFGLACLDECALVDIRGQASIINLGACPSLVACSNVL